MQEAVFSWNSQYQSRDGSREQFTVRSDQFGEFVRQLNEVRPWLKENGYTPWIDGRMKQVDAQGAVIPAGEMPPAKLPQNLLDQTPPQPPDAGFDPTFDEPAGNARPPAAVGKQIMDITRIVITPRADGKTQLGFWKDGRKFPELTSVMTPDSLAKLMAKTGAWKAEHFTKASDIKAHLLVTWENSERTNQNGVPYKNVVDVQKAATPTPA